VSDSTPRPPASFPERIGRYELLLPIASGGMATVYLSTSRGPMGFEAELALKLTHPHLLESPEFAADLLEEAKIAARIRHRNVATVIDADVDPLGVYLVMEYVEGDTLLGLTRTSRPVPKPVALRVLLDALAGLHAAHELRDDRGAPLGVVHRDFTPHNILVGTDGVARLTDFGIAKAATRLDHTRTGLVKGKMAYMAPEQARGATLDRRCDVWAAGVVAWELLAGRRLYTRDNVPTLLKVATEAPPRLRAVVASIHPAVDDAVACALDTDVEARCPTALAFARLLGAACRTHIGVAESEEVAEWVANVVGPKLAARREALLRVRELRAKATSATPTAVLPAVPPNRVALAALPNRSEESQSTLKRAPAGKTERPARATRAPDEPTQTDASSVLTPSLHQTRLYSKPKRFPSRVLFLGAATAVIGAMAVLGVRGAGPSRPVSAGTPSMARTATPSAAPPPSTAPLAAKTETTTDETTNGTEKAWTSEPPKVSVEALPTTPPPSNPRSRSTGRVLSPAAGQPPPASSEGLAPLAPSPY
jgi:serine/threonine-protein kinase